jgi:hypothetical protein
MWASPTKEEAKRGMRGSLPLGGCNRHPTSGGAGKGLALSQLTSMPKCCR